MPYHDNQFLGELYAELSKREQPNNPFLGFTRDVQTVATDNTMPVKPIPMSSWLNALPDKICKCGTKNEPYHVFCWLCGDKLMEEAKMYWER